MAGTPKAPSQRTADEWLEVLIQQPQVFAQEHSELSTIEQELWVAHLSRRAVEVERLDEIVSALRAAANPLTDALAGSFASAAPLP